MTAHADQARPSRTALLALAGIALLALVLGANLPAWPRILGVLNDAAHAPVFAAFAVLALLLLRDQRGGVADWHYPAGFLITVVAGIAVEWLQGQTGRDASWFDVRTDALGAIGALGAAYWRTTGEATHTRRAIGLGAAMTAATLVLLPIAEAGLAYARRAATFPTVMSFASPLDQSMAK